MLAFSQPVTGRIHSPSTVCQPGLLLAPLVSGSHSPGKAVLIPSRLGNAACIAAAATLFKLTRHQCRNAELKVIRKSKQDSFMKETSLFDPITILSDEGSIERARKLEMGLGRFAMLGAVGFPAAELYHEQLADATGLPSLLTTSGQAPSVVNGGQFSPAAEAVVALSIIGLLATALEKSSSTDVLNPAALSPVLKSLLREAQTVNGRIAMVAVVMMGMQEAMTGKATVEMTPFLFHP